MNIGVFGGTFNPPHMGHIIVAEHVRETLGLAKVLFVPSAISPHKQDMKILDANHRMEMVRCAIEGSGFFEALDVEIRRGGISFTIDTLRELRVEYPDDDFYLLMGVDNFIEFQTWKSPESILELAHVVVMSRPGANLTTGIVGLNERIKECEVPEIAISSSEIRRRVKEGKSIRYLVPPAVEAYIVRNHLYQ